MKYNSQLCFHVSVQECVCFKEERERERERESIYVYEKGRAFPIYLKTQNGLQSSDTHALGRVAI